MVDVEAAVNGRAVAAASSSTKRGFCSIRNPVFYLVVRIVNHCVSAMIYLVPFEAIARILKMR